MRKYPVGPKAFMKLTDDEAINQEVLKVAPMLIVDAVAVAIEKIIQNLDPEVPPIDIHGVIECYIETHGPSNTNGFVHLLEAVLIMVVGILTAPRDMDEADFCERERDEMKQEQLRNLAAEILSGQNWEMN